MAVKLLVSGMFLNHFITCMPNMKQILTSHNNKIITNYNKSPEIKQKECNCRNKNDCPLQGKCLTDSIVYQATVTQTSTNKQETYVGLTEGTFKTRYNQHKASITNTNKITQH